MQAMPARRQASTAPATSRGPKLRPSVRNTAGWGLSTPKLMPAQPAAHMRRASSGKKGLGAAAVHQAGQVRDAFARPEPPHQLGQDRFAVTHDAVIGAATRQRRRREHRKAASAENHGSGARRLGLRYQFLYRRQKEVPCGAGAVVGVAHRDADGVVGPGGQPPRERRRRVGLPHQVQHFHLYAPVLQGRGHVYQAERRHRRMHALGD